MMRNRSIAGGKSERRFLHDTSSKIDSKENRLLSEVQKDIYCEPCKIGQTEHKAHGFCTNCTEYLCISCFVSHKNHKAFKDHILQNEDEMPKDDINITIEDHCLKHEDKPIEYYCKSCDELVCSACMFKQHRSCQNVDYIPDKAETLEDTDEYKELTKDMNNLATKCTTGWKSLEASLRQNEQSKVKALLKIKMETADIKKVFDRLETKMKNTVQERYMTEQRKLIDLKEKQKALTGQFEMAKKRIEDSKKARQKMKLFISVKKERKAVDDLKNELQKLKQENATQSYTFKASKSVKDIKSLLELGELNKEDKARDYWPLMVPGASRDRKRPTWKTTRNRSVSPPSPPHRVGYQSRKQRNDLRSYMLTSSKSVEDLKDRLEIGELNTEDKAITSGLRRNLDAFLNHEESAFKKTQNRSISPPSPPHQVGNQKLEYKASGSGTLMVSGAKQPVFEKTLLSPPPPPPPPSCTRL